MIRRRQLFFGVAVLFGVSLFVIVLEWKSALASRKRLAALSLERSHAVAEIERLRQTLRQNEKAKMALQQEWNAGHPGEAPAGDGSDLAAGAAAVRRRIQAWADLRYGRLFKVLGLTPPQIAEFEALAVNHQLALHDIAEAARENGVVTTNPAVVQLLNQETDQYHAQEADLLGPAGYPQLLEDNRTSEPRGWVNSLAGNLFYSDPLSAPQEDRLVQILANQSPGYQGGGDAATRQIQDWGAVFAQAQGVLSPAQFEAMKTLQATFPAGLNAVKEALASPSR